MDGLFGGSDWFHFVESNKGNLANEISKLDGNRLLNTSEEVLVKYFLEKYYFTVPTLNEEEISVDQHEVDIDVSRDPNRFFFDRTGPFYVKGTNITFHIPFTGEEVFFQVQPTKYYMQTFQGRIANGYLVYSIANTEHNPAGVKQGIEKYLREVNEYLATQRRDAISWNSSVENSIRNQISERKSKLLKDQKSSLSPWLQDA